MFNIQMLYVNRAEGCDAINTLYISVNDSYGQDKLIPNLLLYVARKNSQRQFTEVYLNTQYLCMTVVSVDRLQVSLSLLSCKPDIKNINNSECIESK